MQSLASQSKISCYVNEKYRLQKSKIYTGTKINVHSVQFLSTA